MKKETIKTEAISVTKIDSGDLQELRDNNITITSFVRASIKKKADELRALK